MLTKKSQTLLKGVLIVSFISLFFIGVLTTADLVGDKSQPSPSLGQATIISTGKVWQVLRADGVESKLEFWASNLKDKKTAMGWILPKGEKCSDVTWKTALNVYDSTGASIKNSVDNKAIKPLTCESAKCDGRDCYYLSLTNAQSSNLQDLDYVKLGEHSFVAVYQDKNLINYNLEWAEVNVSLSCENINQNDLFIYEKTGSLKFGANGTFEGLKNCTYKIDSTADIKGSGINPYITDGNLVNCGLGKCLNIQEINFRDVCSKYYEPYNETIEMGGENFIITSYNKSSNCHFTKNNPYEYQVNFLSDKFIDPTITNLSVGASLNNVTCENGGQYCHLSTSDPSLVVYYPFDVNTSIVYDWSNYNNDGEYNLSGRWNNTGKYGGGYYGDGKQSYIYRVNPLEGEKVNFSMCAWVNPDELHNNVSVSSLSGSATIAGLTLGASIWFWYDNNCPIWEAGKMYVNEWAHLCISANDGSKSK